MLQSDANYDTFCGSSLWHKVGQFCYKVGQFFYNVWQFCDKLGQSCYKVRQKSLQNETVVTKWYITHDGLAWWLMLYMLIAFRSQFTFSWLRQITVTVRANDKDGNMSKHSFEVLHTALIFNTKWVCTTEKSFRQTLLDGNISKVSV